MFVCSKVTVCIISPLGHTLIVPPCGRQGTVEEVPSPAAAAWLGGAAPCTAAAPSVAAASACPFAPARATSSTVWAFGPHRVTSSACLLLT